MSNWDVLQHDRKKCYQKVKLECSNFCVHTPPLHTHFFADQLLISSNLNQKRCHLITYIETVLGIDVFVSIPEWRHDQEQHGLSLSCMSGSNSAIKEQTLKLPAAMLLHVPTRWVRRAEPLTGLSTNNSESALDHRTRTTEQRNNSHQRQTHFYYTRRSSVGMFPPGLPYPTL